MYNQFGRTELIEIFKFKIMKIKEEIEFDLIGFIELFTHFSSRKQQSS